MTKQKSCALSSRGFSMSLAVGKHLDNLSGDS
jgi:hypothetical protein